MTHSEVVQIDKRFVAVIVTILIAFLTQAVSFGWWASGTTRDIAALQATDAELKAADVQIRLDATAREARLRAVEQGVPRLEAQIETVIDGIERLNNQIDRLVENRP